MVKKMLPVLVLFLFISGSPRLAAAATLPETLHPEGGEINKAEDPRALLERYLAQLPKERSKTALRKEIINIVKQLSPPPKIPETARRVMSEGKIAFGKAFSAADEIGALVYFEKAADLAPWWADAYFNLGLVQDECGRYAGAADSFRTYLLISPAGGDAEIIKDRLARAEYAAQQYLKAVDLTAQGIKLFNDDNYAAAAGRFKEAMRLDPKYALAHSDLGCALKMLGQCKEAIPEFYEGIRLGDDKDLSVYLKLAWCLDEAENNSNDASVALATGLQKDPNNSSILSDGNPLKASAYYNLGIAQGKVKEYASAIECVEQSIAAGYKDTERARNLIDIFKRRMNGAE